MDEWGTSKKDLPSCGSEKSSKAVPYDRAGKFFSNRQKQITVCKDARAAVRRALSALDSSDHTGVGSPSKTSSFATNVTSDQTRESQVRVFRCFVFRVARRRNIK